MKRRDRTGDRVGVDGCLEAVRETGRTKRGSLLWLYRCDHCGGERAMEPGHAKNARHCGCKVDRHRQKGSLTYESWQAMRRRCLDKNARGYSRYGGAGVTICPEWDTFSVFLEQMGERPSAAHTLDRIDGAKVYSAATCRWATKKEQGENRCTTVFVSDGTETLCVADWARRLGVQPKTIHDRLKRGWPPEKAVHEPPNPWRRLKRTTDARTQQQLLGA